MSCLISTALGLSLSEDTFVSSSLSLNFLVVGWCWETSSPATTWDRSLDLKTLLVVICSLNWFRAETGWASISTIIDEYSFVNSISMVRSLVSSKIVFKDLLSISLIDRKSLGIQWVSLDYIVSSEKESNVWHDFWGKILFNLCSCKVLGKDNR